MELSNAFVCAMGMGVVFIGLIALVFGCKLMSFICRLAEKKKTVETEPEAVPGIENKAEIIAAITAVIAEETGEDISGIRICSFKRV